MRGIVLPAAVVLALAAGASGQDLGPGQASGSLEVAGLKVELEHAYLVPDRPGHSRLVLSDVALEAKQVRFSATLDQLARDGRFHGIEVKLGPSGASVEQWVYFKGISATPSWLEEKAWTRAAMSVQKDAIKGGLSGQESGRYSFTARVHAVQGGAAPPSGGPASSTSAGDPPSFAAPAGPVVRVGGGIAPPKKVTDVAPTFPEGVRGSVILELTVGPNGAVTNATVLRGSPGLDEPARQAALQWVYEPTLVDGKPVSVLLTVSLAAR
jgi:TonB family protein